jgi:hypothetical protein
MRGMRTYGIEFVIVLLCSAVLAAAQTPAAKIFSEPSGKYTLKVPPGWTIEKSQVGYIFSKDFLNDISVGISEKTSFADAVNEFAGRMTPSWARVFEIERGEGQIAGQRSIYREWLRINKKGARDIARMAVVQVEGINYGFLTNAEEEDWAALKPEILTIEQSFKVGRGGSAKPAASQITPKDSREMWDRSTQDARGTLAPD